MAGAAAAEERPEAPPDPLDVGDAPAESSSSILAGGSVPPSLLAPSRFRIGDFALLARTFAGLTYDDNVEAEDDDREDDVFLTVSPSVRAQSVYARHSLGFDAAATAATALENSSDDVFDWRVGADGRLDLSRTSRIDGAVAYSRDVEDDEDVDSEDDDGDVPIHRVNSRIGYDIGGQRLGLGMDATLSRFDIDDDDFDDRDSTSFGLAGSARYRWSDNLTLSAGPSYRRTWFDENVADDGDGRDSDRLAFQVGAGYQASRTISARAALGYATLMFDDPDRDDEDRVTGNAGLTWAPGGGTTLDLGASRSLDPSVEDGEDARTRTTGSARLTHRLPLGSRSAISSSLALRISRLSDLDRTDKDLIAGLTYGYRLADHAAFTSSYRFSRRDSSDGDADFYRNVISLGVTLTY